MDDFERMVNVRRSDMFNDFDKMQSNMMKQAGGLMILNAVLWIGGIAGVIALVAWLVG